MALNKRSISLLFFCISTFETFARAGGGGRRGFYFLFGTRFGWTVLLVFGGVAFLVYQFRVMWTRKRLATFAATDKTWEVEKLKQTVEQTYFKVQNSWNDNNLQSARDLLTERMLKILTFQLDYYKQINRKNVLKRIRLKSVAIISAKDHEDDSKDIFVARIAGSMIDYDVDLKTGKKIGSTCFPESFRESWTFKRNGDKWLLDEIKG